MAHYAYNCRGVGIYDQAKVMRLLERVCRNDARLDAGKIRARIIPDLGHLNQILTGRHVADDLARARLTEREAQALILYFCLDEPLESRSMEKVGELMGHISTRRVQALLNWACGKIGSYVYARGALAVSQG